MATLATKIYDALLHLPVTTLTMIVLQITGGQLQQTIISGASNEAIDATYATYHNIDTRFFPDVVRREKEPENIQARHRY